MIKYWGLWVGLEAAWTLPFPYLELVEKFVVGGDGGSAGARISRPIIVIRLESKLINKIKATGSGALFLVFIEYFCPFWYSMV